jgi:hypothetical protein
VVLGHSLGGIMLVDLLSRPRSAGKLQVSRLITAGSQSPMLFKCDALGTMRLKTALPAGSPFTPWLNIFDRNDFLSFCGSRAFPGVTEGIEDFEVDCGVPFPEAHSAYFHLEAIKRRLLADARPRTGPCVSPGPPRACAMASCSIQKSRSPSQWERDILICHF